MVKCLYDVDHQSYLCYSDSIDKVYESDHSILGNHKYFQTMTIKETIIKGIIYSIIIYILMVIIHETGHALAYTLMGVSISKFETFPGALFTHYDWGVSGFISVPHDEYSQLTTAQKFIGTFSGPLLEILVSSSIFIFAIVHDSRDSELFAILVGLIGCLEFTLYPICDIFLGNEGGDWTKMIGFYPIMFPIAISIIIGMPILYFYLLKKHINHNLII